MIHIFLLPESTFALHVEITLQIKVVVVLNADILPLTPSASRSFQPADSLGNEIRAVKPSKASKEFKV